MKPGILAVAAVAVLAVGALTYRSSALRDSMKDFDVNIKSVLDGVKEDTSLKTVKGSSIETKLDVSEPPSLSAIDKAIADLRKAQAAARKQESYSDLVEQARDALASRNVVKTFAAKVYCGRTLQFKRGDTEDEAEDACNYQTPGAICYKGDVHQALDLIRTATQELDYWSNGGENNVKAWIHDGKIHFTLSNTGQHEARRIIVPCK